MKRQQALVTMLVCSTSLYASVVDQFSFPIYFEKDGLTFKAQSNSIASLALFSAQLYVSDFRGRHGGVGRGRVNPGLLYKATFGPADKVLYATVNESGVEVLLSNQGKEKSLLFSNLAELETYLNGSEWEMVSYSKGELNLFLEEGLSDNKALRNLKEKLRKQVQKKKKGTQSRDLLYESFRIGKKGKITVIHSYGNWEDDSMEFDQKVDFKTKMGIIQIPTASLKPLETTCGEAINK